MAKISVVEAARKLETEPEEFLKKLKEFGIYVEDIQSTFDTGMFTQVRQLMETTETPPANKTEKRISAGIVRRRRRSKSRDGVVETPDEPMLEELETEVPADEPEAEVEIETIPEALPEIEPIVEEPVQEQEEIPEAEVQPEEIVEAEAVPEEAVEIVEEAPSAESVEPVEESPVEVAEVVEAAPDQIAEEPVTEPVAEPAPKATKGSPAARKVQVRGVTKEPARIVSKPEVKIDSLKPSFGFDRGGPPKPASDDAKDTRGKRGGRRVVEVGRRGDPRRARKKAVYERDSFGPGMKRKKRELKSTSITTPKAAKRKIKIMEEIQVGELAHRMGVKAGGLIKTLMGMGVMATINQVIDFDTALLVAGEHGFEVENISVDEDEYLKIDNGEVVAGETLPRPPVVTIMGHVDHGKTTLLDAIRKTDVAGGEAGGITQAIGAYNVNLGDDKGRVVFIDTPGHETFTAMRARGAMVTDIVVLLVAADDGVMPQTIEAIDHARDAEVPIIVAINKIDKPNANIEKVRQLLTEHNLLSEEWGGETLMAEMSAKKNEGVKELLDLVLLQAEMMELKASYDKPATGVILEAMLDKGRGPVATVLIQEGTLKTGDSIVSDTQWGRVRMMFDDKGRKVEEATPSMPVEVLGLGGVPSAGSAFNATSEERVAKQVAGLRGRKEREKEQRAMSKISLDDFYNKIQEGSVKELKLILKADVQGSLEAIKDALSKLSTEAVAVKVIRSGAGAITEADVKLASASNAVVLGFSVRPKQKARALAEAEKIDIRMYDVIYNLVQDIHDALEGLLDPTFDERTLGHIEVRETFNVSRLGTIAGCYVTDGKVPRNAKARLVRDGVVVYTGKIDTLRRFKDDVKEVASGFECGIRLENYNDVKIGDEIEPYEVIETAGKL
jgi:translation initiation factor IF-2